MNAKNGELFPELNKAHFGDGRPDQRLFSPHLIHAEAMRTFSPREAKDRAYEILSKWAQLESSGKLARRKETTLEGEFLTEVFGQALGYTLFSEDKKQWEIEPKFTVNGGIADAAIGLFAHGDSKVPRAVIELKGPTTNLDRDRFNGRTAVYQCWDYLADLPQCPWGIVCNYVSFRLYHREKTRRVFELFTLQDLLKRDTFDEFYYIFERGGLLPTDGQRPRADLLLVQSNERQEEIGDRLYEHYDRTRRELILHLTAKPRSMNRDEAIAAAQKLIDRVVFVAFCEDRGLLPLESLRMAHEDIPPFARVTNPRWRNLLQLFESIDKGNPQRGITPYNGGLFATDAVVDSLELDDDWTGSFKIVGEFDFRQDVNVEVLGHLFEKSVTDLERIKACGLLDAEFEGGELPKMQKSPQRKLYGIYFTPPAFTKFITRQTIGALIAERFDEIAKARHIDPNERGVVAPSAERATLWFECFEALRQIKIVDPACGSGAFLIAAYDLLEERYRDVADHLLFHQGADAESLADQVPDIILRDNLFGVDLTKEAVEITQLALWIRSARLGKSLADLAKNIVWGNSLVDDAEVHPAAMTWQDKFPQVFERDQKGFDCVIGNPPWERLNLKAREFFAFSAPHLLEAPTAEEGRELISDLETKNPALFEHWVQAKNTAEKTIAYVRACGKFELTAQGDINTYSAFAELALNIVAPQGRVGLLVPSAIATDHTTKDFFAKLVDSHRLIGLYDFENRKGIFQDVHRAFKFSVLLFGGSMRKRKTADFVFFAHDMKDLEDKKRHLSLTKDDIKLLNPNTRTCPVFRSQRDAELTIAVYRRIPILIDESREDGGNPWEIKYMLMFHQSFDAKLFTHAKTLTEDGYKLRGNLWQKGKSKYLPLYEAKMIQAYDHRAAGVLFDKTNWTRQGQTVTTTAAQHQNPEYLVQPRWWINESEVTALLEPKCFTKILAFKNVTSSTNQRTMIAAFLPYSGVVHSAPLMLTGKDVSVRLTCCLLANLNSLAYDFVCRQKVGGNNLSYFIINQIPALQPHTYADRCPWDQRQSLEKWISERVLKLTCTSNDMIPLAEAAGFDPPVHLWKAGERADLMAQLDAAYFILYGIERDDLEYILSTFSGAAETPPDMFGVASVADKILKHYDHLRGKMGA